MIITTAQISIMHQDKRENPHERAEFAWTPGALTGKNTFVENVRCKRSRLDSEVRGMPDEGSAGVTGRFSPFESSNGTNQISNREN